MKSYWIVTRNNQSVLEPREVPVPKPGPGEIVIKVQACAFNRGELIVGSVVHGGDEKLGGNEAAGIVESVGAGVERWKVGDRVMGRARGAFAEYSKLHEGQAMPMPERLSWEQAAATPAAFITAYEATVRYGKLQAGEWLLIAGVSSGVGVACLQTAKVLGARTIGTSGSPQKLAKLTALGLDVAIPTRAPDFAQKVIAATGKGAQIAVNLVGGTVFPEIMRSLARDGRLAIVGYVDGVHHAEIDLTLAHVNRLQIYGISNARLNTAERIETTKGFVRDILPAIADGRITPVVDRVFTFAELPAAKAYVESNAQVGKVVARVQ